MNLVLIAHDASDRALYQKYLEAYENVELQTYASVREFQDQGAMGFYSGFIIDIKTIIKADSEEKTYFSKILNAFPVLRVRRGRSEEEVSGLVEGKSLESRQLFDTFVKDLCANYLARGIRLSDRKVMYFSVRVRLQPVARPDWVLRSTSADISYNGFFLVLPNAEDAEDEIEVTVKELDNQEPLRCAVRWRLRWGVSNKILPGIGVEVLQIQPDQREQMLRILRGIC